MIKQYDASSLVLLKELDYIRKKPHLYIGEINKENLNNLIKYLIDYCIDDETTFLNIKIDGDLKGIKIKNNGKGISTEIHPIIKMPIIITIFNCLGIESISKTIPVVINAFSKLLIINSVNNKIEHELIFRKGKLKSLFKLGITENIGKSIYSRLDEDIFGNLEIHFDDINEFVKNKNLNSIVTIC